MNDKFNRKPTHRLKVKDEKANKWMEVGAAWQNSNGSISIRLNACVVLDARLGVEPVLFPTSEESKGDTRETSAGERKAPDPDSLPG